MKLTEDAKEDLTLYLSHLIKSGGHQSIITALEMILDENQGTQVLKIILPLALFLKEFTNQYGSEALFFLGICYTYGLGVELDTIKGRELYGLAAKRKYAFAQLYLGECYQWGYRGLAKDLKKAAEFYHLAAKQGNVRAQLLLGCLYRDGKGVTKDGKQAVKFLRQAADTGDAESQSILAGCYDLRVGVAEDKTRAAKLWRLSADQGFVHAQYSLGVCYSHGDGLPQDNKLALKFYELAADKGHILATFFVGHAFYFHTEGVVEDEKRAIEFFTIAAAQGDLKAQDKLSRCYGRGRIDRNSVRQALLIRIAAERGEPEAIELFEMNRGFVEANSPSLDKAVAHYTDLARKDNLSALTTLAFCFQMGLGCEQDLNKAIEYYQLAASKGALCTWDLYICYRQKSQKIKDSKVLIEFCNSLIRSVSKPISPGDSKRAAELEVKREQEQQTANDIKQEQALVLAYAYEYGAAGLKQDLYEALTYYKQARNIDTHYVIEKISYYSSLLKVITLDWKEKRGFNKYLKHLQKSQGHPLVIKAIKNILSELQTLESFKEAMLNIQKLQNVNTQHGLEAICFMAYCYGHGVGVEQDKKQSVKLISSAADQKYTWAQYQLSLIIRHDIDVPKNEERAKELLIAASEQGLVPAQNELGETYLRDNNKEKAVELFIKSSEQGCAWSYITLGRLYGTGDGVTQDEKRSAECYALALAQNEPGIQLDMGELYSHGKSWIPQDVERAVKLYTSAAEQGFELAQIALGLCYRDGRGVVRDERKAASFFALAAAQNHPQSQYLLGKSYRDGMGLEKDQKQAAKFFTLAAAQGYAIAERLLGECYEYGIGVIKDIKKAMELYILAAAKSDVEALRKLAGFYAKGSDRHMLLIQALANKQDKTASEYVISIFSQPKCQYPTLEKALTHYSAQASDQDLNAKDLSDVKIKDCSALVTLAFCYQMGLGCEQNLNQAIKYYLLAFNNGAPCAWDLLQCYNFDPDADYKTLPDFSTKLETTVKAFQPPEDVSKTGASKKDISKTASKEVVSQGDVKEDHEQKHRQDTINVQQEQALALAYAYEHGKLGLEKKLFSAIRCYNKSHKDEHVQGKILYYQSLIALRAEIHKTCPSLALPESDIAGLIAEYAFDEPKP